jgi:mono/diheme cytochrome c family protein
VSTEQAIVGGWWNKAAQLMMRVMEHVETRWQIREQGGDPRRNLASQPVAGKSSTTVGSGVKVVFAVLAVSACLCGMGRAVAAEDLVEHGRYIFYAAGCVSCHTSEQALAGGRAIATPFGTFYSPNITPHREQGIGSWSQEDFVRALRDGISPGGEHYYPAFPYPSYTRMTGQDMRALWAYLMSQPAVARKNRPHDLPWFLSSRSLVGGWKTRWFRPGVFAVDPTRSPEWNRGAYLATALGHCGECHTPRGVLGAPRPSQYLAGTRKGPEGHEVPNITPDRETGVGHWPLRGMSTFLATGRTPDERYTGPLMAEVLGTSTMRLTEYDRHSLAIFLRSLPPIYHDLNSRFDPFADSAYFE